MDGSRFDRLVRDLAGPRSRRGLLGGLLGAALAAAGVEPVAAARRGPGRACRADENCVAGTRCLADGRGRQTCRCLDGLKPCGEVCIPAAACCANSDCAALNGPCARGVCLHGQCQPVFTQNGRRCADGVCCDGACVACCNGVGACIACSTAAGCPGTDDECQTRVCQGGFCGVARTASGTPLKAQVAGDCQRAVCNGRGGTAVVNDDDDRPADDGNQCTRPVCANGRPGFASLAAGSTCSQDGGSICDGSGACVECLGPADCPGEDRFCQSRTCENGVCGEFATPYLTPLPDQIAGDCQVVVCDGAGGTDTIDDDADAPDSGNPCLVDGCRAGSPVQTPAARGESCGGGLICDGAGACVDCVTAEDCPGADTECATRTCIEGSCGAVYAAAGTALAMQSAGDCQRAVCDGSGSETSEPDDADLPDDGRQCTRDICTDGLASHPAVDAGTGCDENGGTVCDGQGACVQPLANGVPSIAAVLCASGFLVDGVCCDAACDDRCHACTAAKKGEGDDGVCGAIVDGLDPDDECPAAEVCDGAGACRGGCLAAADCPGIDDACQWRTCIDHVCGVAFAASGVPLAVQTIGDCLTAVCDGAGGVASVPDDDDAPAGDENPCAAITCSGGVVQQTNAPVGTVCAEFPFNRICNSLGQCVEQAFNGVVCSANVECRSDLCVDGYCCNSPCTETCRACNVEGRLGDCVIAPGTPCAANGGTVCDANGQCVSG